MKNFVLDEVVIENGNNLPTLAMHAINASHWLNIGAPDTKPKSVETLIAEAESSTYALFNGHTVGHVAVVEQTDWFPLWVGGGGRESMQFANCAHVSIESLAVMPDLKGQGIGSLVLEAALNDLVAQATTDKEGPTLTVVSALACAASMPLFEKFGFTAAAHRNQDLECYVPYIDMDMAVVQAQGKGIVSTVLVAS